MLDTGNEKNDDAGEEGRGAGREGDGVYRGAVLAATVAGTALTAQVRREERDFQWVEEERERDRGREGEGGIEKASKLGRVCASGCLSPPCSQTYLSSPLPSNLPSAPPSNLLSLLLCV